MSFLRIAALIAVLAPAEAATFTFRASSRGANAAEYNGQYGAARFYVNGSLVWGVTGGGGGGRGINVATFVAATGAAYQQPRNFDTWGDGGAAPALVSFLNSLPNGTLILIAAADDAGVTLWDSCTLLTDSNKQALLQTLETLGSQQIRNYCYRASWALAAVKGQLPAKAEQLSQNAEASVEASITTTDATSPTISISSPTSLPAYTTSIGTLALAGTAQDDVGVTEVTATNSAGGNIAVNGTTNWSAPTVVLQPGLNTLTVTARDAAGNTSSAQLAVTYNASTNWFLTFHDPFDGDTLDLSKWIYDLGTGMNGWGNNELQTYTNRNLNVSVAGGFLSITARSEAFTGVDLVQRNYTSGRILTRGKFTQAYGRFEARMKVPAGRGLWPAFWSLGDDFPVPSGWPASGEIDFLEHIGREPSTIYGTVHGPGYSGANGISGSYSLPAGQRFADAFHLFAVEWEPNVIRWYVDDQLYKTVRSTDLPSGGQWVFDHPVYMLLNLAVGGDWPGSPDAATQFPATLLVDYVKVYRREPPLPDASAPIVTINSPTTNPTFATSTAQVALGGTSRDDVAVTAVTVTNEGGGSAAIAGTKNWISGSIPLQPGVNVLTVTARDAANRLGTATLTVTYSDPTISPLLLVPAPNTTLPAGPVEFTWSAATAATKYRRQIVYGRLAVAGANSC